MSIREYLEQKRNVQSIIQEYLNSNETKPEQLFQISNKFIDLREICHLLIVISNYKYHNTNIFKKIEEIILYLKNDITSAFSNADIYSIFQNCKQILLILFANDIITMDKAIINIILNKSDKNGTLHKHFFYPEIKDFLAEDESEEIKKQLYEIDPDIFINFNEKRQKGENDSILCSLIRDDSINEFVLYTTEKNILLSSNITPSIFETNSLLLKKKIISLIEYAAFYGSIKIIQYLKRKGVDLMQSMWIYAIHSNDIRLIHFFEDRQFFPDENMIFKLIKESIKCHNDNFSDYFINNYLCCDNDLVHDHVIQDCMHYNNYLYLPDDFKTKLLFFYSCKYNYLDIVKILLNNKSNNIDINDTIVPNCF